MELVLGVGVYFPLGFKSTSVLAWAWKVHPCFGNSSAMAWRRHGATTGNVISASLPDWPRLTAAGQDRLVSHYTSTFRDSCMQAKAHLVSHISVDSLCYSSGYSWLSLGHHSQLLPRAQKLCQKSTHSLAGFPPGSFSWWTRPINSRGLRSYQTLVCSPCW